MDSPRRVVNQCGDAVAERLAKRTLFGHIGLVPLRYESIEGVLDLMTLDEADPTPEEWDAFLKYSSERQGQTRWVLVHSLGGGPNAQQRNQLRKLGRVLPVAVCTSSIAGRGIVTALGWIYRSYAAFDLNDIAGALRWLGAENISSEFVKIRIDVLRNRKLSR